MNITIFKIIAPISQGDVKIGLPKGAGIKDAILPKSVLNVIAKPIPSAKHEYLISQGDGEKVQEALNSYGYLRFHPTRPSELGFIDPDYKNENMKVWTMVYNPENQTPEDFAEAVNFLRKLVAKKSDGVIFDTSTKALVYTDTRPILLSKDITAEDVDPQNVKKKRGNPNLQKEVG